MEIGGKIKKLLKDNKLSLREFCIKNDLIYTTVTFQLNKNNPGYDILEKLYKSYPTIDIKWLFGNTEEEKEKENTVKYNEQIIDEVIQKMKDLKKNMTQS